MFATDKCNNENEEIKRLESNVNREKDGWQGTLENTTYFFSAKSAIFLYIFY
jgi:hypothetical protein